METVGVAGSAVQVYTARDLTEAREYVVSAYVPLNLVSRNGKTVDFRFSHVASNRMIVGHLRYGADVEVLVEPLTAYYQVDLTLSGHVRVHQRGARVVANGLDTGVVLDPCHPFSVRYMPDAAQYAIMVSRAALESHLAALMGHAVEGPIAFDLRIDLACPQGQVLLAAVRHLHVELSRLEGVAGVNLIRAQLESYVLTQILLATGHRYRESLLGTRRPAGRAYVRDAVAFIEEHAQAAIAVADIARHVNVCVRALQLGFLEEVGVSPTAYLRSFRLQRAYEDIVSQAEDISITEIAYRWGFNHLGRFAQSYRDRFGLLPSETPRNGSYGHS